jgi:hypothetical protein
MNMVFLTWITKKNIKKRILAEEKKYMLIFEQERNYMLTFEQFKAKLEDACLFAINHDKLTIRSYATSDRCSCPLGTKGTSRYPGSCTAMRFWDISYIGANSFINGFSGHLRPFNYDERYYNLGKIYRNKFG